MRTPHPKSSGGIAVLRDQLGRLFLRRSIGTADMASQFWRFQSLLLSMGPDALSNPEGLALMLLAFDGITTRQSLASSLRSINSTYQWHKPVCVEWDVGGWVDRRDLSRLTRAVLSQLRRNGEPDINVSRTIQEIDAQFDLDALLAAASAWLGMMLPGPLLAHVLGHQPMAALPREVLARESARLAIFKPDWRPRMASLPMGVALDGYFAGEGKDQNPTVVESIRDACQAGTSPQDMHDRLITKLPSATLAGPITSLIAAWAVDLVESGTARKSQLSINTIKKYVKQIVNQLFPRIQGKAVVKIDVQKWMEIYADIESVCAPSIWRETSAALTSWHEFLVDWLDVPELPRRLYGSDPDRPPRANVVWPHELELIHAWLNEANVDERLVEQMRVTFAIAANARIRIGELLSLRLKNFQVDAHQGMVEIEISPGRLDPSLKSPSGRRRIQIENAQGTEIILGWLKRRHAQELALNDDYLFGDPHDPEKLYAPGRLCAGVNALLKAATGDPQVSLHTLSHTRISGQVANALISEGGEAINPLDRIASEAGHFGSHTTLLHYSHRYEAALRHLVDTELKRIPITSRIAARWLDTSDCALRQRASRSKQSVTDYFWDSILAPPVTVGHWPPPEAGMDMRPAVMPEFLNVVIREDFLSVVKATRDLSHGIAPAAVALRCARPLDWVNRVASIAGKNLSTMGIKGIPHVWTDDQAAVRAEDAIRALTRINAAGAKSGFDFGAIDQPKLATLKSYFATVQPNESIFNAVLGWQQMWRNGYVCLKHPLHTRGLIRLLIAARLPVSSLAIITAEGNAVAASRAEAAAHEFMLACGFAPQRMEVSPKRGRPHAYLILNSRAVDEQSPTPKASASMGGLNALMLSAATWIGILA